MIKYRLKDFPPARARVFIIIPSKLPFSQNPQLSPVAARLKAKHSSGWPFSQSIDPVVIVGIERLP